MGMSYYKTIPGEMCDFHTYYERIADNLPNNCTVIEVGVADGHSAIFLAEQLLHRKKSFKMFMVDSMDYGGEEQYITVLTNIIQAGLKDSVTLYKLDSLVASCKFNDGFADFVFIDASHKYSETLADCRLWYHKVKTDGILAGHDMTSDENPEVKDAVNAAFKEGFVNTIHTKKGLGVWEVQRTGVDYQLNTWPHHIDPNV